MEASRIPSDFRSVAKLAVVFLLVCALSVALLTGCDLIEKGEETAKTGTSSETTTEPSSESEESSELEESSEPEETSSKGVRLPMDEW